MNNNLILTLIKASLARSLRITPSDAKALGLMSQIEVRRELEASRLVKPPSRPTTLQTKEAAR